MWTRTVKETFLSLPTIIASSGLSARARLQPGSTKGFQIRDLAAVLPYLARRKGAYLLAFVAMAASSVFGLFVPWKVRDAVDSVVAGGGGSRGLSAAVAAMAGFAVLHAVLRFVARRLLLSSARRVEQEIRDDLFLRVVALPLPFFSSNRTGDFLSRFSNDLSAVWLFLGPGLLMLSGTVITYLVAIVFLLKLSVPLTCLALLAAPPVVLLSRAYGKSFQRRHRRSQEVLADLSVVVQEDVAGIRVVKAYGMEEAEEARFAAANESYADAAMSVARGSSAFHSAMLVVAGGGTAVVLFTAAYLVIRGELSPGGLVAFNAYLAMLAFPTMALGWVVNMAWRADSAMGRIGELMREATEAVDDGVDLTISRGGGGAESNGTTGESGEVAVSGARYDRPLLAVRGLSYSWPGSEAAPLRDISFTIRRGEVVGLVGPTGCGKSTLMTLLLRLRPVPCGTVFLDGTDVAYASLRSLRGRVAWVPQDPFLFPESIRSNLLYGSPGATDDDLLAAVAAAGFDGDLAAMSDGLDTVVGERGISLSGGQKQRVTLARALLSDASILLLDDALASVDAGTEARIFDRLLASKGARAVLFATHRMATMPKCDRVLFLSDGRIVEEGAHDELMALDRLYARFQREQGRRDMSGLREDGG